MSVMELSHRSQAFGEILESAHTQMRRLMELPDDYQVLFLQGGATLQFSMVPMNFLADNGADFIVTGTWSSKAQKTASKFGRTNIVHPVSDEGFVDVPKAEELRFSQNADYIHYVSNETIDGVEFPYEVDGSGIPVVCDASSNILSKRMDISKYLMIYAGAQKNLGPSGVTVVIIHDEFLERCRGKQRGVLSYQSFADNESMPNTPNTWGIYLIDLVCKWLQEKGGVDAIAEQNARKAAMIYDTIDESDGFYRGTVTDTLARSRMNVTFTLDSPALEAEFCDEAARLGLVGLEGHRSVGGIRASIYNAFPVEGVERLVEHMRDFANSKG